MRVIGKRPQYLVFLMLVSLGLVSLVARPGRETGRGPVKAVYKRDRLSLSIPYEGMRAGFGTLTVEIVDPDEEVLGRVERRVEAVEGAGVWRQEIKTFEALPFEDLVWERIRYRFRYSGETVAAFQDVRSVSEILLRPVVHVLAQSSYMAGAEAAIRVIVLDSANKALSGNSSIKVELLTPDKEPEKLFSGRLNHRGTLEAQFRFPAKLTGNFQLHYVADTPLGVAESTQPVRLEEGASILLTTEKRMYQPGQTIHIRTLVLDRAEHHAVGSGEITFEIEDPRGNKVFRNVAATDEFGIASTEFTLADEVNLGKYQLHALMGKPDAPANSSQNTFTVERYVLPKFKVAIAFTAKDGKPRREYRPGDHVTGTVQANYFFGKPVGKAEIKVKASGMDAAIVEEASASGFSDNDGSYHFDLRLPDFFAGRPQNASNAPVVIEATVKDGSGHAETRAEAITVSESALLLTAVPESGALIPGLENRVFLLASYPDGTPAQAELRVHGPGVMEQVVETDSRGVAVISVTAGKAGSLPLKIKADDRRGNRVSTTVTLELKGGTDAILLRPDRAIYQPGDRIALSVFSTSQSGTAYVDIVKDGQTILTRDVDILNGHAALTLNATAEMSGTLNINAYRFGRDAQQMGDHRLVFVQPAEELRIQATADASVYRPGADAHIQFRVTNTRGEGLRAALGLQVVDDAVFALTEQQPGFAKTFFYLEQEVMNPRFEIHGFSMPEITETTGAAESARSDRAAQALFAATSIVKSNKVSLNFGEELPQDKRVEYQLRYRGALQDQLVERAAEWSKMAGGASGKNGASKLDALFAEKDGSKPRDAWGTELHIQPISQRRGAPVYYRVSSAGPDREWQTADDLYLTILVGRTGLISGEHQGHNLEIKIDHDRGPFNGFAQMSGTITDASGAVVSQAMVRISRSGIAAITTQTDALGSFSFQALAPGTYQVQILAAGFQTASHWVTLQARDVALLSGVISVGNMAQTVEVTAAAPLLQPDMAAFEVISGATDVTARASVTKRAMAPPPPLAPSAVAAPTEETRVRNLFPETLYINPEIITDHNGVATLSIPMADSITNWRMAMLASTTNGALGSAESAIKVFQDFFVDLDLPVTLTQGDRVSVPVAIYNYAGQRGNVTLTLENDDWFALEGDSAKKSVQIDSGHVGGSSFTLEAKRIGRFQLKLSAGLQGAIQRRDIVVREIEVVPNGREQSVVFNGQVDSTVQQTVRFPQASIADASKIFVRLYPGAMSQVIEGMDAILQMPNGCFEQTSSSTYPNVLALDYMKRTKKLTPEVHAKAEAYIANGYQRLLTFEVVGGGFSWFGSAPANKILTAYGLMEFNDMSRVHDVEPKLITRTRDWLISQQQRDGSWKPDSSFINEGATNRYNFDLLRITAYIAWALEDTGYRGVALDKAKEFMAGHLSGPIDAYTLAVLANFAVENAREDQFTRRVMSMLMDARVEKGEQVYWNSQETGVYSTGASAAIETTGLAAQALLKWAQSPTITRKAIVYIASQKDAAGTWGTTQATIMALHALLMASEATGDAKGEVQITLNGRTVQKLALTAENGDLYHQFVLAGTRPKDANQLEISFRGNGNLAYQIVGRYFVPWEAKDHQDPLSIAVTYDRTKLPQNEIIHAKATIKNNTEETARMVMIDLGIPPGFELLTEDLEAFREKSAGAAAGSLEKFSLTATQAILYFNGLAPNSTLELRFRLRAKYPIRAQTFQSRVYEYYDPATNSIARPQQVQVIGN